MNVLNWVSKFAHFRLNPDNFWKLRGLYKILKLKVQVDIFFKNFHEFQKFDIS